MHGSHPQATVSQAPVRSGWLGWLPVHALEDNTARWSSSGAGHANDDAAEEAVEAVLVEDDSDHGNGQYAQVSTAL